MFTVPKQIRKTKCRFSLFAGPSACAVNYKMIRDPAVQRGKPLPEKGGCKHYKQSHRWLRYHHPCVLPQTVSQSFEKKMKSIVKENQETFIAKI